MKKENNQFPRLKRLESLSEIDTERPLFIRTLKGVVFWPRMYKLGFTLIEVLIVISLVAIISLAIYTTLNNGFKIWGKINQYVFEEDVDIFLNRFGWDVRNSFLFKGVSFLSTEDSLELFTLVNSPRLHKKTVGKIIYFYDREGKILNREQKDFSQIYSGEEGHSAQRLKEVNSLKFWYYIYNPEKKEYLWQEDLTLGELPLAISILAIRIELDIGNGNQSQKFIKTVNLPISS